MPQSVNGLSLEGVKFTVTLASVETKKRGTNANVKGGAGIAGLRG